MDNSEFHPHTNEEHLAREIAEKLDDPKGLPTYLSIAKKHSESRIRQILEKVLKVPEKQIRISRGAYFNWLIQHENKRDPKTSYEDSRY